MNLTYAHEASINLKGTDGLPPIDLVGNSAGVGITLDSNVSKRELINYRMDLNYEWTSLDVKGIGIAKKRVNGFGINQSLGFGVFKNRRIRVWLGPSVRVAVVDRNDDIELFGVNVGGGIEFGVNFHLNDRISIAPTLGYKYTYSYLGFHDVEKTEIFRDQEFIYRGGTHRATFGIAVLYRDASDIFN